MQRFDHPSVPIDPYPSAGTQVAELRYDSALVLIRLKDAPRLRTGEDADYLTGRPYLVSWRSGDGEWVQIVVPAGLITDLTSVPRALRFVIGRVGPWLEAAIVHDYLYIAWQDVPGRGPRPADRAFADAIMLAAMRAADVRPWMATVIHWAVRIFGGGTFGRVKSDRYVDLSDPEIAAQMAFMQPRG